MIITLIAGIITGFIVSVPPLGPVAFALISKGFKNQFREGLSIAIGTAFMDFIYALIAFGGVSLFISLLPDSVAQFYRDNDSIIQIILIYAGCIIVIYSGIKIMRSKISYAVIQQKQEILEQTQLKAAVVQKAAHDITKVPIPPEQESSNHFTLVLIGIMLCISSITLPASWIAIVGYVKGLGIIQSTFWGGLLFSVGAFLGTVLWFYTLLKLITGNSHRINPLTIDKLNIGAGIVLILLGTVLFVKATVEIFNILI